jgi:hypothetical protein
MNWRKDAVALFARRWLMHREAAVLVVEGDALDKAGEVLAVDCSGRYADSRIFHDDCRSDGAVSWPTPAI